MLYFSYVFWVGVRVDVGSLQGGVFSIKRVDILIFVGTKFSIHIMKIIDTKKYYKWFFTEIEIQR